MSTQAQLDERDAVDALTQIEAALAEVHRVCQPGTRWQMTIPVDVDDSDVVIAGALVAARKEIARLRAASSGPSPAAIDAARKAFSETGEYAHAVSAEQFRMALALKAALYAAYRVDRGASAPPAGPWKVTTRRDADGDHWGVDREPEVGVNWYHGGFATESEALAVRDALNRVAGGVPAVPAPQEGGSK